MCGDFLKKNKGQYLLIGGTGNLGKNIIKFRKNNKIFYPSKRKLNILNKKTIFRNIKKNIDIIINCAGLARIRECEKNPKKAYKTNVIGVKNLTDATLKAEKKFKKKILLIHISTDAVYACLSGNYKEDNKCNPQNVYGKTKLQGEKFIKRLNKFIIIRTRFFNKKKIKYKDAAVNIFSSMIEIEKLVKILFFLSNSSFKGIINIGGPRKSDYEILNKYKNLSKTTWEKISKNSKVFIGKDSSLNLKKFKKLLKNKKKHG